MFPWAAASKILLSAALANIVIIGATIRAVHGDDGDNKDEMTFKEPEIHWIEQRLDNFNPSDMRRWRQRYMVNDQFYRKGGPVLLLLAGEWHASPRFIGTPTHIMLMAKTHNALVFQLEHRFYGKSFPTEDMSTANLRYLSSHQALADAARFRTAMMRERSLEPTTKWVVFGGSYAGTLAAWFRLKYPHLVVGAVASSAPMVATVDFPEFFREVANSLGPTCRPKVRDAFAAVETMIENEDQWGVIGRKFRTCSPYDRTVGRFNGAHLLRMLALHFENAVQNHRNTRLDGRAGKYSIDAVCDLMRDRSPFDGLVAVNDAMLKLSRKGCLQADYAEFIRAMRNASLDAPLPIDGGRQWLYQTCAEFGFFQSSNDEDHVFGSSFPTEYFIGQCRDTFGESFNDTMVTEAVARTNREFGGTLLQASNVTFSNGSIDPWHSLSVLNDLSADVTSDYIVGTAHCSDMYPPTDTDPGNLLKGRRTIEARVARWLQ